ncbi:hypothetical protein CPB83DRAFT_863020 [Crepidotus variabilis]|uniref:Uncharacterized protein n=1 Tax=Crepidotus variabilis TaxID=179855 RepID=A0A9P6E685_9AGAR|nr:hypothetical protein CPB83DRAFT_863020 [Crepidotus variabilis]
MHQQHLAWLSEEEPDIELSQPVYTSYSYPNTSGDEDEIDESQTSNPFLRSPSASPSSPLLAPEPDMAQDQTSTSNTKLVPTLSIPASTIPLAQRSTPTSTQQAAPPSPAPTEIEFPESQDITVDIQRRGVRIRDFAYAPPYVREIRKGNGEREKGTEPNTPAASFYHGGGPSPTNLAYGSISASASFSPSTLPSSSPSPLVYPIYRTPEIFDQYKAMTEVDYRWTQSIRTFPIAGKSLRRLLDMGWLTEQEVRASASDADLEELRVFDERRKQAWENRMDEKDEMKHEEMEVDNIERFGREMEVFPWRWIRKGKWVKLAGGIERDDEDDDEVEDEAPLPPLPFPPINSSTTSSTAASMLKPLPALPLPPIPPPKPLLFPPPPPPFEPGTIPPLSTSSLADLIAYDPPPTLITSLPPFPPAPRAELRAVWVDIKRGYWRQVDRMWVVSREREMRRRREMEEAGKKVREIDERERARKLGMVGKRECSPGKRKVEGEEDDMDIQEDSGGAGTGHEQGQGGVKRRRLSPLVDENVPPSSSKTVVTPVSVVSSQRGARPSTSSVSRSGNPHLQVHPARVVSSSSSNHYPAQSSPAAFSSNLKPPYPSSSTPYSSSYSSTNLIPPEKQYPAPAAAYNPRLYPDARSAKRAQAGVIGMSDSGMKGKAKEKEGAPLERQDTPILDDEAFQSQGSQAQGPSSSPSPRQKGQSQVQTQGEVRVSSAHQGQRLVHPKKTLGGLSRQKSFNEL